MTVGNPSVRSLYHCPAATTTPDRWRTPELRAGAGDCQDRGPGHRQVDAIQGQRHTADDGEGHPAVEYVATQPSCDGELEGATHRRTAAFPVLLIPVAPEIMEGRKDYSFPVDVYSFGIILWELMTREEPYEEVRPGAASVLL